MLCVCVGPKRRKSATLRNSPLGYFIFHPPDSVYNSTSLYVWDKRVRIDMSEINCIRALLSLGQVHPTNFLRKWLSQPSFPLPPLIATNKTLNSSQTNTLINFFNKKRALRSNGSAEGIPFGITSENKVNVSSFRHRRGFHSWRRIGTDAVKTRRRSSRSDYQEMKSSPYF